MKVQIPGKIVLLGEWAVLDGHKAIVSTAKKHFTGEILSQTPLTSPSTESAVTARMEGISDNSIREFRECIWSSKTATSEICGDDFQQRFFKLASILHQDRPWPTCHLRLHRGWKLSEGFGSSSAALLATMTLHQILTEKLSSTGLDSVDAAAFFRRAREINTELEGVTGSGIDLAAQIYGGTLVFQKGKNPEKYQSPLPEELLIIHTGMKALTRDYLKKHPLSSEMKNDIGRSVQKFLNVDQQLNNPLHQQENHWKQAINEHAVILEHSLVAPPAIVEICQTLKKLGLVEAIKTTGAGGGDALLAWTSLDKKNALEEWLKTRGFWLNAADLNAPGLQIDWSHKMPENLPS